MPSSKCGGLMSSQKMRSSAARPMIAHGTQSCGITRSRNAANQSSAAGESARAVAVALLVRAAMRILVTGGCGFIGSNFIRYILEHYKPTYITNVDVLTYAGNLANLDGVTEEYGDRY